MELQLSRQDHLRDLIDGVDDDSASVLETKPMLNHFPPDVFKVNAEDFTDKKK